MKLLSSCVAIAGMVLGLAARASADTVWNVNANFSDGATAIGIFDVDSTLTTVTDWNIDVSGSSSPAANHLYKNGDPGEVYLGFDPSNAVAFANFGSFNYLDLYWGPPGLSNLGGTLSLLFGDGGNSIDATIDCGLGPCGTITQGSVTGSPVGAAPVPEPASLVLLGTGVVALIRRRVTHV
jgi:hypothetical protein